MADDVPMAASEASLPLRFRPHHFFCALGFEGKGYSEAFTANMTAVIDGRLRGPGGGDTVIEVTDVTDTLCAPCPKRRGTKCTSQPKIIALDQRHAEALDLSAGDQLTWAQAQTRMAALPQGILERICTGCQWLEMGMCASAHRRLKQDLSS